MSDSSSGPVSKAIPYRKAIRPTTIIQSPRLSQRLGAEVTIISETFQLTGSFKFRAAYNVVLNVPQPHVICASSGNFGQAMAYACKLVGKGCTVVMPHDSVKVKVEAVRAYGATVDLIDVGQITRAARVRELATQLGDVYIASPFDDPLVINGNASLGDELLTLGQRFDKIIVPVGGGGLLSGILQSFAAANDKTPIWGAEPLLGNDAARSLREGRVVANEHEPKTIADGARTVSVGQHNWPIIRDYVAGIIEVPEEHLREGLRLLYSLANLKVEPTSALPIGAILTESERFAHQKVGCVVSGGNVDAALYSEILSQVSE